MNAPILVAAGLTHRWSRGADPIIEDVSFEMSRGEVVALLGPNGSGKSTLMKFISGLLPLRHGESEGTVLLRGEDFLSRSQEWRARQVAYLGYGIRAEFPMTAYEAVMLGRTAHGSGFFEHIRGEDRERVEWAMRRTVCWNLRERDLNTLSGGERQLVGLARALVQNAKVLLLDESLSQMDLNHQALVGTELRKLAREGFSILLVSHDVNLASEWADRCLILQNGKRVAFGPLREVLDEERIRSMYPGAELFVRPNPVTGAPKVFFGGSGSTQNQK